MISGQVCVISHLRGNMALLCFVLTFCFRIENNYLLYTQKAEIPNVCVLLSKYNAYVEQLLVYG